MDKQNFKSEINFDGKVKMAKVYLKTDKNGKAYFMGDMNKSLKILIQKNTGQYAKEGEYQVSLVPVKWTKIEEQKATNMDGFPSEQPNF